MVRGVRTCSIVYSSTGIWIRDLVRSSLALHMAATSGMPKLVVLAAPQKHTATTCSRGMRRKMRERMRRERRVRSDEADDGVEDGDGEGEGGVPRAHRKAGGRADRKHTTVNIRYSATLRKTLKMTEAGERR